MKLARRGPGAWALPAVLLLPLLPGGGPDADDLLFEPLAQRWLERHGARTDQPGGWPALLEERFAHLAVGLFDLRIPTADLADAKGVEHGARAVQALLEAQAGWLAWSQGATRVRPEKAPKDDPLAKWLAGWSPRTFAGKPLAGLDLAEASGAPPSALPWRP